MKQFSCYCRVLTRIVYLVLSICMLSACGPIDDSIFITDDAGVVHRTIHYLQDRRGREYFPMQVAATGNRQFIFDPRAYAWAAYDAAGQRMMTGAASGGK